MNPARTPGQPSARELEVLTLHAAGWNVDGIASRLYLSPETVKTHLRRTVLILGAANRTHAVAIGITRGLITLTPE